MRIGPVRTASLALVLVTSSPAARAVGACAGLQLTRPEPRAPLSTTPLVDQRLAKNALALDDLLARWPGVILATGHPRRPDHGWTIFYTGVLRGATEIALVGLVKDEELKVIERNDRLADRFLISYLRRHTNRPSTLRLDGLAWTNDTLEISRLVEAALRLRRGLDAAAVADLLRSARPAGPRRKGLQRLENGGRAFTVQFGRGGPKLVRITAIAFD